LGVRKTPWLCHDRSGRWGHHSGLDTIGALGIRISAVDFDGDGWPDIIARLYGAAGDGFSPGGARLILFAQE